jgi:hypothetical protein
MGITLLQAIKQTYNTDNQYAQRAIGASGHAFSFIVRTGHLSLHC